MAEAGGRARRIAAAAVALVAGGLVLAATATALQRPSRFQSTDPGSFLAQRLIDTPAGFGLRLDAAQRADLYREIAAHPLDGDLLALGGLDATARGDRAAGEAFTTQALAVQPRARLAWLWRTDQRARTDRPVEAAQSVLRLLAVDQRRYLQYMPILAQLANDPRTKPVLTAALQRNPPWRTPFLELLAASGSDPGYMFGVMQAGRETPSLADGERATLLASLIARNDYERAYLAWLSFLPDSAVGAVTTPYDAAFHGLPGPPPFNWVLLDAGGDSAEAGPEGLELSYSGRTPQALAQQIVLLPAGGYRLTVEAQVAPRTGGSDVEGASPLGWTIQCRTDSRPLGALPLAFTGRRVARATADFTVPADCPAVLLALRATPDEFPTAIGGRIARALIAPAAARAP